MGSIASRSLSTPKCCATPTITPSKHGYANKCFPYHERDRTPRCCSCERVIVSSLSDLNEMMNMKAGRLLLFLIWFIVISKTVLRWEWAGEFLSSKCSEGFLWLSLQNVQLDKDRAMQLQGLYV
ncbi:hypothetical protein L1987_34574 [Smallanthus sonchifolius]|uniref:Uncharacterized protein n=1 Tax=Smallanthus sonchifolius TaxID=185202 RepID=A0ACB9HUX6_9ASTR|nr:hypothetical protein L1987_34574 [Smallanthus sonchifolius]